MNSEGEGQDSVGRSESLSFEEEVDERRSVASELLRVQSDGLQRLADGAFSGGRLVRLEEFLDFVRALLTREVAQHRLHGTFIESFFSVLYKLKLFEWLPNSDVVHAVYKIRKISTPMRRGRMTSPS